MDKVNQQLLLSDFDYDLPKELIAQTPLLKRDESKLLVVNRDNHRNFYNPTSDNQLPFCSVHLQNFSVQK